MTPPDPGTLSRRTFLTIAGAAASTLVVGGARRPIPRADHLYADVAAMFAQEPFYVAHRGCSRSWPEMSGYAYAQSALRGFGALELSLARTRDGVWFGLHDETLNRTSGITRAKASALTWADVQAHRILGSTAADDPAQPDRPYLRWEELIETYYPAQVIFVDPKYAVGHRRELMAKMNALPGTPQDHFVCKYYGVSGPANNSSGWARLAANNGYRRWGYFFGADAASIPRYEGRWDILGLDYAADASLWAQLQGYGKPIIGHLVSDSVAVATARARGAAGLMVSEASVLRRVRPRLHLSVSSAGSSA